MPGLVDGGSDLKGLREKIESSVPKKYQRGFDSIMAAGLKLMFSDKTFGMTKEYLESIASTDQIPDRIAHGVAKAMSILMNESKGHMPIEPSGAAAQSLMTHALEYVQRVKGMPVTPETIGATTKATNQGMMQLLQQYSGLNPEQFQQVLQGRGKELMHEQPTGTESSPQPVMDVPPQSMGQELT